MGLLTFMVFSAKMGQYIFGVQFVRRNYMVTQEMPEMRRRYVYR